MFIHWSVLSSGLLWMRPVIRVLRPDISCLSSRTVCGSCSNGIFSVEGIVLFFCCCTMASFPCALKKIAVTRLSNHGTNIYGFFGLVPGLQLESMLFFYFSLLSCSSSKRMRLVSSSTDGSWS